MLALFCVVGCVAPRDDGQARTAARTALRDLRCVRRAADSACAVLGLSVYELLARPDDYDGERVQVSGFVHAEFEGAAIYAHREDFDIGLAQNGLGFEGAVGDSLNDQYLLVEGRFDAPRLGHLGVRPGSIVEVSRVERLPRPVHRVAPDSVPVIDLSPRQPPAS